LANNGLNINLHEAAAGHVYADIRELLSAIDENKYDDAVLDAYRKKYLPEDLGMSTGKICDLIMKSIREGK
jgi:hypothetical protein